MIDTRVIIVLLFRNYQLENEKKQYFAKRKRGNSQETFFYNKNGKILCQTHLLLEQIDMLCVERIMHQEEDIEDIILSLRLFFSVFKLSAKRLTYFEYSFGKMNVYISCSL